MFEWIVIAAVAAARAMTSSRREDDEDDDDPVGVGSPTAPFPARDYSETEVRQRCCSPEFSCPCQQVWQERNRLLLQRWYRNRQPAVLRANSESSVCSLQAVDDEKIKLTFKVTAGKHDDELWELYSRDKRTFRARVEEALQRYFGNCASVQITDIRKGSIYIDALIIVTSCTLLGAQLGDPISGLVVGAVLGIVAVAAEKLFPEELQGLTKNLKDFSRFVHDLARILFGGFGPSGPRADPA